jgi:hypothetical protein
VKWTVWREHHNIHFVVLRCCGRIRFADEQTAKEMGNRWALVDGDGCGREGGGGGRLLSLLWAKIQPPIMVDE